MTQTTDAGRTARREPPRIWVEVRGGGVILPERRQYVAVVGRDYEEPKSTEYVRADLVSDLIAALEVSHAVLTCVRDPEARSDRDKALASVAAALAAKGAGR